MCNQSNRQDQLRTFIVNNAYSGQTLVQSLLPKDAPLRTYLSLLSFRIKPRRYEKSINSITPSLKALLRLAPKNWFKHSSK